ncbi:MAG: DUF1611 domain-containing protein [Pseudomonadota bacterium]
MTHLAFSTMKWCFSARRIDPVLATGLKEDLAQAAPGDMILGRVISIGNHTRIQLPSGRPATLYPGDLVALPCGARYAPDQFEGVAEIDPKSCDMLAGGGCVGLMRQRNERIKPPTQIQPLGRITGPDGRVLNTRDFALPERLNTRNLPAICVIGTSMNSGKTTAAVALSHGLTRAGYRVGALKATGTGSFGDFNKLVDSGATYVADFSDAGMATTYLEPMERVIGGIDVLLSASASQGCDIAVVEIADGIFQRETAALLADPAVQARFGGFIFACGDAVAAAGGVLCMAEMGIRPMMLTGMLSCSPIAAAEAEHATGVSVLTKRQLEDPAEANALAAQAGVTELDRAA